MRTKNRFQKKEKKEKKKYFWTGLYRGEEVTIKLASEEELHFQYWVEEAVKHGYLYDWVYQPVKLELTPKQVYKEAVQLKTKISYKERVLLKPHTYTPDWELYPTEKFKSLKEVVKSRLSEGLVIQREKKSNSERDVLFVDVKGSHNQNDAWRRFAVDQKMTYVKHGIFVNKIIPGSYIKDKKYVKGFFEKTWVPGKAKFTSRGIKSCYRNCFTIKQMEVEKVV